MSSGLPEFLDLARVTRQPLERAGRIRIGSMPRLAAVLSDSSSAEAQVELDMQDDGSGRIVVQGTVAAQLALICQRCLKPMSQHISTDFRLVWVRNEAEAAAIEIESTDPLLSEDGRVKLAELVEDELLLALPIVALHKLETCGTGLEMHENPAAKPEVPARQNPFAMLKQLKQQR